MLELTIAFLSIGLLLVLLQVASPRLSKLDRLLGLRTIENTFTSVRLRRSMTIKYSKTLDELPDLLWLVAIVLRSGQNLFASFSYVSERAVGGLADDLRRLVSNLKLGASFESELQLWGRSRGAGELSEVVTSTLLALKRGAPLAATYAQLAESMRGDLNAELIRRSARNESRMLLPLVFVILPTTVLFAVFPSITLLQGIF